MLSALRRPGVARGVAHLAYICVFIRGTFDPLTLLGDDSNVR